jgi:Flp pilus assembly protein protease CpaA
MIEIMILVALAGSVAAGLWDVYTTEVPDEIPAVMVAFGVFYWFIDATATSNFFNLGISLLVGTVLLVFGFAMYKTKQWGGADALMLAAIGYVLPVYLGRIFMLDYIFNFFIVGAAYTIVYAIILGFMNRFVFGYFVEDIKKNAKIVAGIPGIFACFVAAMYIAGLSVMPLLYVLALIILITIFWRYGVVVESRVFKRKVKTKDLKPGDVIDDMHWVGLTAEQIKSVQKKKKYAIVKEGIRFVPAFPIALVVTLLVGNILFWFI